jgi:hypothetical protein
LEEKIKEIAVKKELVETQAGHLEDQRKLSQKRRVAEEMKNLTPKEFEGFKSSYEKLMLKSTTGEASRFLECGWEDKQVQFMFELFITKEIQAGLEKELVNHEDFDNQEKILQEKRGQLSQLYDMGIKALKELRSGKKILPKTLVDNFDVRL